MDALTIANLLFGAIQREELKPTAQVAIFRSDADSHEIHPEREYIEINSTTYVPPTHDSD